MHLHPLLFKKQTKNNPKTQQTKKKPNRKTTVFIKWVKKGNGELKVLLKLFFNYISQLFLMLNHCAPSIQYVVIIYRRGKTERAMWPCGLFLNEMNVWQIHGAVRKARGSSAVASVLVVQLAERQGLLRYEEVRSGLEFWAELTLCGWITRTRNLPHGRSVCFC